MKILVGHSDYHGYDFLLQIDEEGNHTISTRPDDWATWSAPVALVPQSSEVSGL